MNLFQERLRSIIPNGLSQKDFAQKIGVAGSTFSTWLAGDATPKIDALNAIAAQTGCDLHWLITGKDEANATGQEEFTAVRRLHVHGSAGDGALNAGEKEGHPISFRKNWLRDHVGVSADSLSVIEAKGDSMEPTIRDGALVLVNHKIERIENDGIYALSIDGDLYIKRVQNNFGGGIVVKSDNPSYADQTIGAPETLNIKILGLIKWAANTY